MNSTVSTIQCERLLVPSSINLGEYVINPYRGCSLGCRYCYVQKNRNVQERRAPWGSFVDVKINAPEILRQELARCTPEQVLIGSTTEVYQLCEEHFGLMRELLIILNAAQVGYTLLTRSPLILRDADIIKENRRACIYVTVNSFREEVRTLLEPAAAPFRERIQVIKALNAAGIVTRAYVNPVIPFLSNVEHIMTTLHGITKAIDFEGINMNMVVWSEISALLSADYIYEVRQIEKLLEDQAGWDKYWAQMEKELRQLNKKYTVSLRTFFHPLGAYFSSMRY